MAKVKTKAEVVRAPADKAEAGAFLALIGTHQRDVVVIQAAAVESITQITERAAAESAPHTQAIEQLTRGLQLWAEANRSALTQDGKTKTVILSSGEVAWRARPPSVRISNAAGVIAEAVRLGLEKFLRRAVTLNKEAMLADREAALTLPGVSIGSAGEEFVVAPIDAPKPVTADTSGSMAA